MNPSVEVAFPSGTVRTVYPIQVLAQALHAETMAKFGVGLTANAPTLKALRAQYEIPASAARTWAQIAPLLRQFKSDLDTAIANAQA